MMITNAVTFTSNAIGEAAEDRKLAFRVSRLGNLCGVERRLMEDKSGTAHARSRQVHRAPCRKIVRPAFPVTFTILRYLVTFTRATLVNGARVIQIPALSDAESRATHPAALGLAPGHE